MSVISIRLNAQEEAIFKNYAKSKNSSISQLMKDLIFEKIEDEFDIEICKEYLVGKEKEILDLISFEEAIKEWNIK